jgi:hypothetical protein
VLWPGVFLLGYFSNDAPSPALEIAPPAFSKFEKGFPNINSLPIDAPDTVNPGLDFERYYNRSIIKRVPQTKK